MSVTFRPMWSSALGFSTAQPPAGSLERACSKVKGCPCRPLRPAGNRARPPAKQALDVEGQELVEAAPRAVLRLELGANRGDHLGRLVRAAAGLSGGDGAGEVQVV